MTNCSSSSPLSLPQLIRQARICLMAEGTPARRGTGLPCVGWELVRRNGHLQQWHDVVGLGGIHVLDRGQPMCRQIPLPLLCTGSAGLMETYSPMELGAFIAHFESLPPNTVSQVDTCSHLCHTSRKCLAPLCYRLSFSTVYTIACTTLTSLHVTSTSRLIITMASASSWSVASASTAPSKSAILRMRQ